MAGYNIHRFGGNIAYTVATSQTFRGIEECGISDQM
jgi:hypothetical protein